MPPDRRLQDEGLRQVPATDKLSAMNEPLTAADLLPLVQKLSATEQLLLAKLALRAAAGPHGSAAASYATLPVATDEFGPAGTGLDWEAEGWEEFDAKG
jgi:hypothetical protein